MLLYYWKRQERTEFLRIAFKEIGGIFPTGQLTPNPLTFCFGSISAQTPLGHPVPLVSAFLLIPQYRLLLCGSFLLGC